MPYIDDTRQYSSGMMIDVWLMLDFQLLRAPLPHFVKKAACLCDNIEEILAATARVKSGFHNSVGFDI